MGRANVEEKVRVIVGKRGLCRVGKRRRFEKGHGWENKRHNRDTAQNYITFHYST